MSLTRPLVPTSRSRSLTLPGVPLIKGEAAEAVSHQSEPTKATRSGATSEVPDESGGLACALYDDEARKGE
jgi:hypothetical protein